VAVVGLAIIKNWQARNPQSAEYVTQNQVAPNPANGELNNGQGPIAITRANDDKDVREDPIAKYTLWLTYSTIALVFATGILGIFAYKQSLDMRESLDIALRATKASEVAANATHDSVKISEALLVETKKSIELSAIAATQKRAIVFIEFVNGSRSEHELGNENKAISIKYILRNYGESPAIITKLESHIYISENEPDLKSPSALSSREDMSVPGGEYSAAASGTNILVVAPGSSSEPIQRDVGFRGEKIKHITNLNGIDFPFRYQNQMWLHCIAYYKDVYGFQRETSYFARINAAASPSSNQEYNYWK
jgi:hypothetical protein